MTLRNFQVFVEVCKQGSMSAAAKELYISQSAISQIIKEMESHYNVALFRRISHKLYLTDAGKKLYSHATGILNYNEVIETSMSDISRLADLRVGSTSAFIMIDLAVEYRNYHPTTYISMRNETRKTLEDLLSSSQVDVAIVSGLFSVSDYDFFPLTEMETFFVCNKDTRLSPLLEGDEPEITIEELAQFPLYIWSISDDVLQAIHSAFFKNGLHYNIAGSFLHCDGVSRITLEDMGIGVLNQPNFEKVEPHLKKIRVKGLSLSSPYFIACLKQNSNDPLIKSFIEFSQDNFDYIKNKYSSGDRWEINYPQ